MIGVDKGILIIFRANTKQELKLMELNSRPGVVHQSLRARNIGILTGCLLLYRGVF